jgi:hypothetical protein
MIAINTQVAIAHHLGFHCVLTGGQKSLDPQVLFDPFEEQFNLPGAFVERSNY